MNDLKRLDVNEILRSAQAKPSDTEKEMLDLLAVAEATLKVIGLRQLGPSSVTAARVAARIRDFRASLA